MARWCWRGMIAFWMVKIYGIIFLEWRMSEVIAVLACLHAIAWALNKSDSPKMTR